LNIISAQGPINPKLIEFHENGLRLTIPLKDTVRDQVINEGNASREGEILKKIAKLNNE
jgi:hypothetical protein